MVVLILETTPGYCGYSTSSELIVDSVFICWHVMKESDVHELDLVGINCPSTELFLELDIVTTGCAAKLL